MFDVLKNGSVVAIVNEPCNYVTEACGFDTTNNGMRDFVWQRSSAEGYVGPDCSNWQVRDHVPSAIDKMTVLEVERALIDSGLGGTPITSPEALTDRLVAVFLKSYSPAATYEATYVAVFVDDDSFHDSGDVCVSQDSVNGKRVAEFV